MQATIENARSMTLGWWKTLLWLLLLRLMGTTGEPDTAFNTCLFQSETLSPGERHNLTIPCTRPQSAEFQLSYGDPTSIQIPASYCATTSGNSELSLIVNNSTPQGPLNLTIFCHNLGPLCYSFTVGPPGPNTSHTPTKFSILKLCNSNDSTPTVDTSGTLGSNTQGNALGATADSQSNPTSAAPFSQQPGSSAIDNTAGQKMTSLTGDGASVQTSPVAGTNGQVTGSPTSQTTGQATQSTNIADQGQSAQGTLSGTPASNPAISSSNSQVRPTQGNETGDAKGTGRPESAQSLCTCEN